MHWHICLLCHKKWHHDTSCHDDLISHTCPCGEECWEIFNSESEADEALYPPYHHKEDPYEIIPTDWDNGTYKVLGFRSLDGLLPKLLTVKVQYSDGTKGELNYIGVLYVYFRSIDEQTFCERGFG